MKQAKKLRPTKPRRSHQGLKGQKPTTPEVHLVDSTQAIDGSECDDAGPTHADGDRISLTFTAVDAVGNIVAERSESCTPEQVARTIFAGGHGNDLRRNDHRSITAAGGSEEDEEDTAVVDEETLIDLELARGKFSWSATLEAATTAVVSFDQPNDQLTVGGAGVNRIFGRASKGTTFSDTSAIEDELLRSVISGRLRLA